MEDFFKVLNDRIIECVDLCLPEDKVSSVKSLLARHSQELFHLIKDTNDPAVIRSKFSNFINKTLSTIEVLGLDERQFKAIRKLILSEINGCQEVIIREKERKIKK